MTVRLAGGHRSRIDVVLALGGALAFEGVFTFIASVLRTGDYGAPIPVGACKTEILSSFASGCQFAPALFAVNVLITAVVLWSVGQATGRLSIVVASLGATAAFFGLPPLRDGPITQLVVWVLSLLVGTVIALVVRGVFAARSSGRSIRERSGQ